MLDKNGEPDVNFLNKRFKKVKHIICSETPASKIINIRDVQMTVADYYRNNHGHNLKYFIFENTSICI